MVLLTGREKSDLTVNKACWSSGQDATLSRWKQGFDPPTGYHIKLKDLVIIAKSFNFLY